MNTSNSAPLDALQQVPVDRTHDLGRQEPARGAGRQRPLGRARSTRGRARRTARARRGRAATGRPGRRLRPRAGCRPSEQSKRARSDAGMYAAAAAPVDAHVPQDVRQLQRHAEVARVVANGRLGVLEDLGADQADGRRHAMAVGLEILERLVRRCRPRPWPRRRPARRTRPGAGAPARRRAGAPGPRACRGASPVKTRPTSARQRIERRGRARRIGLEIHAVVDGAAEVEDGGDGVPLRRRQRQKRVIEAGLPGHRRSRACRPLSPAEHAPADEGGVAPAERRPPPEDVEVERRRAGPESGGRRATWPAVRGAAGRAPRR